MSKILVIEDEYQIRKNLLQLLEFEGFEVVGAEDGEKGIEIAKHQLPDLIICDIMMTEVDGYEVLLRLRLDPSTSLIPFIFLTAKADKEDMRQGMNIGADDYLTKPFTDDELLTVINTRLEKHEKLTLKFDDLRENLTRTLPHELRTPLTAILGCAQIISDESSPPKMESVFEVGRLITQNGLRLQKLIENYLLYADLTLVKNDPERLRLFEKAKTIINKSIESYILMVVKEYNRDDDLHIDVKDAVVQISEEHLQKIVVEVVENAFKFSKPQTPVTITSRTTEKTFILNITNQGKGMTTEEIANIGAYMQFRRRFYEQQGSGLGLIISKRLTELYGGSLNIESIPNQQTTIEITLKKAEHFDEIY